MKKFILILLIPFVLLINEGLCSPIGGGPVSGGIPGGPYQPLDADLTIYAGITPSANMQAILGSATYATMRTLLDLEVGIDFYSIAAANAAFLSDIVEDLTPTLGGPLDQANQPIQDSEYSLTDSDAATPDLAGKGTSFEFTDDGTTDVDTITGFANFPVDTYVYFRFEDAYWEIDFSGTNLYAHGGIDWEPTAGDSMICRSHDGTKIECIVSRPSALSIALYHEMPFDSTPDSDNSWSGPTAEYENASAVDPLTFGTLVYLRPDGGGNPGGIWPWDADLATYKCYKPIGIVIEAAGIAANATGTVGIWWGMFRDDDIAYISDNADEGKTIYGTTAAGVMSDVAPAVSGDIVCAVGIAQDDDEIAFNFGLCSSVEVP